MKINKVIKNISIILILIMTLNCIFNFCYASDVIGWFDGNAGDSEAGGGISKTREIIGKIISVVQVFGIFIAIAMLMILGIKYMYSSPGDRAQIKNHLTVYIIGAVVMFSAAGILEIIKNFFIKVTR